MNMLIETLMLAGEQT